MRGKRQTISQYSEWPLVGTCSFGMSCNHNKEPGCRIQEAVYSGVISEERFDSWQRICQEINSGSWEY